MRPHDVGRCDVVVVGGGPAGAVAASAAARAGCHVVLVERHRRPNPKTCGEYLCPGGVERLRDLGFSEALDRANTTPLRGMRLFAPSGAEVRTMFPAGRPGLSVKRHDLDPRLVTACGAEVRRGRRVVSIDVSQSRVRVAMEGGECLDAAVVIGADGRNSLVARERGLHIRTRRRARAAVHAFYADVAGCEAMGEMHLPGDGSYVGLNPGPDGLVNFTYVCDLEAISGLEPREVMASAIESVPSLRRRFARAVPAGQPRILAPLEVVASRAHDDRVLLAGDAAGFLDPLTGEGMYGAIVSGELAGRWAAMAALRGSATRRDLAGYSRARRRLFGSKTMLNRGFQWLLQRPRVLEFLRRRLRGRQRVGDTLIRVIGNTENPAALLRPRNLLALVIPGPDR